LIADAFRVAQIVERKVPTSGDEVTAIPTILGDSDFFGLLGHLFCKGVKFTLMGQFIFAMIAAVYCSPIADRARKFVKAKIGDIYKTQKVMSADGVAVDEPRYEAYSPGFVGFLMAHHSDVLTATQRTIFGQYLRVLKYSAQLKNTSNRIQYQVPVISDTVLLPDTKIKCTDCGLMRSHTIMSTSYKCGMCYAVGVQQSKKWVDCGDADDTKSYFCTCTECYSCYAVIDTALRGGVSVNRRCHFCRNEESVSHKSSVCVSCKVRYLTPMNSLSAIDYKCAACVQNTGVITKYVTEYMTLREFVAAHVADVAQMLGVPVKLFENGQIDKSGHDLYKLLENGTATSSRSQVTSHSGSSVTPASQLEVKSDERMMQVYNLLVKNADDREFDCDLCATTVRIERARTPCDNVLCTPRCCEEYLKKWYGENGPGKVFSVAHMQCPFCRTNTSSKFRAKYTAHPYNMTLAAKIEVSMVAAVCMKCNAVKDYAKKSCVATAATTIANFVCDDCAPMRGVANTAMCPKCDVAIERAGGCAHMTCAKCATHFCWYCAQAKMNGTASSAPVFVGATGNDVYRHLADEHGTLGLNDQVALDNDL
jgi:hypothetical protein